MLARGITGFVFVQKFTLVTISWSDIYVLYYMYTFRGAIHRLCIIYPFRGAMILYVIKLYVTAHMSIIYLFFLIFIKWDDF